MPDSQTAAARVARAFGGFAALDRELGLVRTAANWNRPREKHNGRGGDIPDRYHRPILAAVKRLGLKLRKEDLING